MFFPGAGFFQLYRRVSPVILTGFINTRISPHRKFFNDSVSERLKRLPDRFSFPCRFIQDQLGDPPGNQGILFP